MYPRILGICYGGHDTSAALVVGGKLIAACEQERYSLDKHSRQFPIDAINDCLRIAGLSMEDIDEIAYTFDPLLRVRDGYLKPAMEDRERIQVLIDDIDVLSKVFTVEKTIREKTGFQGPISCHQHHHCHLTGAYVQSGFKQALLASYDGLGEAATSMLAIGDNGDVKIVDESNNYPDSLGLIYNATTFYLGWKQNYDEGIIMGLACFGDPYAVIPGTNDTYYDIFADIIQVTGPYSIKINREWTCYYYMRDKWFSDRFYELFGPKREYDEPILDYHRNIAAALQKRLEDVVVEQMRKAREEFGLSHLVLTGGVCLNCSMNGKIESEGIFDEIYVQPAAGDAGSVVGACFLSHKKLTGSLEIQQSHSSYLGSRFNDEEIESSLKQSGVTYEKSDDIYALTAQCLKEGKIVGWFQGAAEFGPRALGNRSILVKPYPHQMKDYLNEKVKFREAFRPFAPAVLSEHAQEFFQIKQKSPYMLMACKVQPDKKESISAVVHVDDSCRVQTVTEDNNPNFFKLLEAFYQQTGCPVLLNTSFNVKGQPIVNTPQQAIECFSGTNIDFLVIGDYYTEKPVQVTSEKNDFAVKSN